MRVVALVALAAGSSRALIAGPSVDRSTRRGARSSTLVALGGLFEMLNPKKSFTGDCVMGEESIMAPKEHGTSAKPVQSKLRWACKDDLADRICSYNRHYAENAGYWERSTTFLSDEEQSAGDTTFYDSVTGKPLFYAGKQRSWEVFVKESKSHGWPSFRDSEVGRTRLGLGLGSGLGLA